MLEVLVNIINCIITIVVGIYIIKNIATIPLKKSKVTIVFVTLVLGVMSTCIQHYQGAGVHTFIIYALNIIFYKYIFKITLNDSIIATGIAMTIIFLSEMIVSLCLTPIFGIDTVKANPILMIIASIFIVILSLLAIKIPKSGTTIKQFYENVHKNKQFSNVIFCILIIMIICILVYNLYKTFNFNVDYIMNFGIVILVTIIIWMFINNKNEYKVLSNEYDSLFSYVQNFEDWIEKEQLNRHEYKNQLAVLRCLTKEKKVKDKIDGILEDNINIEGQAVTNLKNLPKGGIKGLMYYKAAIAQKNKVNLTTDVSLERKGILTKLSEKDIRILCKLIGIYFDNAIEAAAESRKKNLTIEIYELKDRVNFVFSNTFKRHKNMKDRNKKGVSSKGEGRGNGLYFASRIIEENDWIDSRQDIIDNYYIQELFIKPKKKQK